MKATRIITAMLTGCAVPLVVGCAGHLEGSLNNTEWAVQYLHYQPVPSQPQLTLSFSNEGKISGSAGCNPYSGKYAYTAASGKITVSSINKRLKSCVPTELMEQEREFLQALQDAVSYKIEWGRLSLEAADGSELINSASK